MRPCCILPILRDSQKLAVITGWYSQPQKRSRTRRW